MSITSRIIDYGHAQDALSNLLGQPVREHGETTIRCWQPERHRNGDAHPSATANADKGTCFCHVCNRGADIAQLMIERGLASDFDGVERVAAERHWLPAANGNGKARPARPSTSSWPPHPETAGELGWTITTRHGRRALLVPVVDETITVIATKVRYERGDGRLAQFEPVGAAKGRTALILGQHFEEALERESPPLVLTAGETDLLALEAAIAGEGMVLGAFSGARGEKQLGGEIDGLAALLRGATVAVVYDTDAQGRGGAEKVLAELRACGAVGVNIELPFTEAQRGDGCNDLRDWLDRCGGTARELLRLIEATRDATTDRSKILVRQKMDEVVAEAEQALLADPDAGVYVRSRRLVRVARAAPDEKRRVRRAIGAPVIEPMGVAAIRIQLARSATWVRLSKKGDEFREVPAIPPNWAAECLGALGTWRLPDLEGVIEAPTLRPDGSILDTPGYDDATGLLYIPSITFPPVPRKPTQDQVQEALTRLLEVIVDFPFVAFTDRAAAVAWVLTAVCRGAILGPTPMAAYRATAPGSGKTLLADVTATIAEGRPAARMVPSPSPEEQRKALLTLGLEGAGCTLLDNVVGPFGSAPLSAALTGTTFTDRRLGGNTSATVSLRGITWMCTGNGLTFKGDLARRVVPVDLDAGMEHPEDRTQFKYPHLLEYVARNRGELVVAAITVLRGYHVAGRPSHGRPRIGSFEQWDDLVRGACLWAGIGDPDAGRRRVREEGDADLDELRAALAAWWDVFQAQPVTLAAVVAEAHRRAEPPGKDVDLRDALMALQRGRARESLNTASLGYALRRVKGRLASGLLLGTLEEKTGGKAQWRVARSGGPDA